MSVELTTRRFFRNLNGKFIYGRLVRTNRYFVFQSCRQLVSRGSGA